MRDSEKMLMIAKWLKAGDVTRLDSAFEMKKLCIFDDEGVDRFQDIDDDQMRFSFSMMTLSCDIVGEPIDLSFSAKEIAAGTFLSNGEFLVIDTNGISHVFESLQGPNLLPVRIKNRGAWNELDLEQFIDETDPEDWSAFLGNPVDEDGLVKLAPSPASYPGKVRPKL